MWLLKLGNVAFRVLRLLRGWIRKAFAILFGTKISDTSFQKSLILEFAGLEDFLAHFASQQSRSFFVTPQRKNEYLDSLHLICPGAQDRIIQAADAVCEHRFDLLGSGPVGLGWPIDWHKDFKTGHRWNPKHYYTEIRPAPYLGGYDVKIPWELSRCQHFAWLGQAYWLTGDEKYTREFRLEIEDWIKQNKPEFGVNWACSMDIAIRAINWLWGYAFFQASPVLDDEFRIEFCKSLLSHGRHIMANLEWSPIFTGNHYLSDIVGLIYLGILLPEFKEAQTWREFGLKELESEMFKQVYPDGGNFEASTSYHRLVTELFISATLLAQINGHTFSQNFMERLEKMLEFIYQITKPDGTVPIIGDQDNGRLHRLKVWDNPNLEWKDFRPLLAVGCMLFNRLDWGKMASDHWEEAIWFYGGASTLAYRKSIAESEINLKSAHFKDAGLYIMHADDIYVAIDLGSVGQNGRGGHAHNDTLSFELFASGQTWIQDPGTYVYTADYQARNLFRSTSFHNTLSFSEYEQNRFDDMSLFSLKNESISRLLSWDVSSDLCIHLAGELQRAKHPKITHRRSFFLDLAQRALVITDLASNTGFLYRSIFHFSSEVEIGLIEQPDLGVQLTGSKTENAWLFSVASGITKLQISECWISEGYGLRQTASVANFERSEPNHKIVILLPGSENRLDLRMENALKAEKLFMEHGQ